MLRGLPGSGKSTFAGILSEGGRYPVYCIDDYFTDPETGSYQFVYSENFKAYESCRQGVEKSMKEACPRIIVENVFSMEWEMDGYFSLASKHGYQVHVLTVENRHNGRNIHGISEEQLQKMAEKFKVKLL